MAIEKLDEFAQDGQKNTDGLTLTDGFPVLIKPARQWFNWLFNTLTLKINEIIDKKIDYENIVDNLTTDDGTKPVSAKQAKILQETKYKSNGSVSLSNNYPAWDAASGVYTKSNANDQQTVLHFLGSGSAAAVQFLVNYANSGLFYRSATDQNGFAQPFEKIVTEASGNAPTASKLATARTITLTGAAQGSVSFDGSGNVSIATAGLASGQTWQLPSRVGDTTYTNSSGKPISVLAYARITSSSNAIDIWCSGVKIFTTSGVAVGQIIACSFIVPNGHQYALTLNGHSLISWAELR